MRNRIVASMALLLACAGPAAAQSAPDSGAFLVRLGADTVAVESYTADATGLHGVSVLRFPRTLVRRYELTRGPDGTFRQARLTELRPGGSTPVRDMIFGYTGDAVHLDFRRDTLHVVRDAPVAGRPLPMSEDMFGFWDVALRGLGKADRVVFIAANQPTVFDVKRKGGALSMTNPDWGTFVARMGPDGRLATMDMTASFEKYMVERVPTLDVQRIADDWAAREKAGQTMGLLSPRDTARAQVGGGTVLVDYGRPSMRGRTIFGAVVPWNEVWRTGANEATQLVTDRTLVIGSHEIPPGTYSLWTIPDRNGWTLIVNRQHGQWGTEYHADQDLVRIPMAVTPLETPVEQFTAAVTATGEGGELSFAWERTKAELPFTVR